MTGRTGGNIREDMYFSNGVVGMTQNIHRTRAERKWISQMASLNGDTS
ncbi:MAG TPA: hypothetical protein VJW76_06165 [Verrucomicrobiae bacterium]|nr:hypothetical protein [Verrucomicrobiae bacterium]